MASSAKSAAALEDRFLAKLNESSALDPGFRLPECAAGDRKPHDPINKYIAAQAKQPLTSR